MENRSSKDKPFWAGISALLLMVVSILLLIFKITDYNTYFEAWNNSDE